jgi:cytoskeletal protein CcmA (bactofilin family)
MLTLGGASAAYATDYTCNEGGNPPPTGSYPGGVVPPSGTYIDGDVNITESGDCTLDGDLAASGTITITAGGAVNIQSVYANSDINIYPGSTLTANDIETYSESDGSITIEPGDTATINGDVLATVDLEIYSSANLTITGFAESYTGSLDIETGNVEIDDVVNSATWIDINASNDSIMITGDVTANHSDGNNDILLQAQNNIQTGNIYDSGSPGNGLVEIDDNLFMRRLPITN